ncbi:MAG: redoxin domain-containing protein [Kofleriaceae bacterium]
MLWIDRDNYLLRKSVASTHFEASIDSPPFDSETTTTYAPTLNQQVAAARLHGPEPKRIPPPRTEAWLGVMFAETGTRIARVLPGAAADSAGVQVDDEILSLDGTSTADASAVIDLIRKRSIGASVSLEVRRAGSQRVVKAELTDRLGYFRLQTALLEKTAPSFAVTPVNSASPASLATLAGRLIVLDFTPPSFVRCENCESPQGTFMNKLQEKYGARGLQVVGVSTESASALQKASTELGLRYPLAHDENAKIANAFFVVSPMTTIVIDKKGSFASSSTGPDWRCSSKSCCATDSAISRSGATGRNAWLFVGSDDYGQATGNLLSLIASSRYRPRPPRAPQRSTTILRQGWDSRTGYDCSTRAITLAAPARSLWLPPPRSLSPPRYSCTSSVPNPLERSGGGNCAIAQQECRARLGLRPDEDHRRRYVETSAGFVTATHTRGSHDRVSLRRAFVLLVKWCVTCGCSPLPDCLPLG